MVHSEQLNIIMISFAAYKNPNKTYSGKCLVEVFSWLCTTKGDLHGLRGKSIGNI